MRKERRSVGKLRSESGGGEEKADGELDALEEGGVEVSWKDGASARGLLLPRKLWWNWRDGFELRRS